jgi:hypothetical protein
MSASVEDSTRDRDTIERELRLLVSLRSAYRQRGGALPPVSQMDALLDELLKLRLGGLASSSRSTGSHKRQRAESEDADVTGPSPPYAGS